jgi:hypothetical protein
MKGESYRLFIDDAHPGPAPALPALAGGVWQAVDQRQVHKGMNELQVGFALGAAQLHGSGLGPTRVLTYPNAGQPLVVTFAQDKVVDIQPAPAEPAQP